MIQTKTAVCETSWKERETRISQQSPVLNTKVFNFSLVAVSGYATYVMYVQVGTHQQCWAVRVLWIVLFESKGVNVERERDQFKKKRLGAREVVKVSRKGSEKGRGKNQGVLFLCSSNSPVSFLLSSLNVWLSRSKLVSFSFGSFSLLEHHRQDPRHGRDQLPSSTDTFVRGIQDHFQKHHGLDEACQKSGGYWKLVSNKHCL